MIKVRQHFDGPTLDDIEGTVRAEVAKMNLNSRVKPGDSVAISVGSRGVANIALITKTLVEELKAAGTEPFIVPAMGSHGGGTAEGQRAIVEAYGVTEEYIGAPIRATMEVEKVSETEDGVPVYFDKYAFEADHVVVMGRVKPHTSFNGEIESGLHKMMLIGLGKHKGAALYHRAIVHYSFDRIVRSVGQQVMDKCGILFGLGIVENQYDRTALIRAAAPEDFLETEKEMLILAKRWLPSIPFERIDLLIVDYIGKNISGAGMDTNVVGRKYNDHHAIDKEFPKVTRIFVRDLTEETHGNACGIGIAEYTHKRLSEKIDHSVTAINAMTGNHPSAAAMAIYFDTDREVLDAALKTVGLVEPENARVVRITDTLHLEEIQASESLMPEIEKHEELTVIEPLAEMSFDGAGDLLPL